MDRRLTAGIRNHFSRRAAAGSAEGIREAVRTVPVAEFRDSVTDHESEDVSFFRRRDPVFMKMRMEFPEDCLR
ncbi:MAG TPA: hypothetical protein DE060_08970 [Lentisphaeria bacterium]|nr:hypothetical protein [Lentisphaeria bacterium]HCG49317.1 hypothetical protein [Lentisphaeria bacterium]